MIKRKYLLILGFVGIIAFCLNFAWSTYRRVQGDERAPNVLIISMCSLRYQLLSDFSNIKEVVMPNFEKFIKHSSFIFTNAFNGTPWTAYFDVAEMLLPVADIRAAGYKNYSNSWNDYILRIPHRESWDHPEDEPIADSDFEKNHQAETNYLKFIATKGSQPFYIVAHYKYMHYPLIDRFNADSEWDYYLNGEERRKISEYLNHPEKYPEKLPFLLMLSDDARVPLSHPKVRALGNLDDPWQQIKVKGLLTDPGFLADWQKSPQFKDDLDLLEKVYKGDARYLDKVIGNALNLWGDPYLKKHTIVVLTGDHGEMHMEHGALTHGYSLFDDSLKVVLAIRFPDDDTPVRIKQQTDFWMISNLLRGVLQGRVDSDNFMKSVTKVQQDTFLIRNCTNSQRGLRYKNKYKYIYDIAEDRPYLYDLEVDPSEVHDIASQHPELVERFERQYWQLFPTFSKVDPNGCASWSAARDIAQ